MSSNINRTFARVLALCLTLVLVMSSFAVFAADSADAVYIYVSVNDGDDNNVGSIDAPLKTIGAAQKMTLLHPGKEIHVVFRGGTYRFANSAQFKEIHSGTEDAIIYYENYDGEDVYFKASIELDMTKAKPVTDSKIRARLYEEVVDKVAVIDLKEQGVEQSQILNTSKINTAYGLVQSPNNAEMNAIYINDKEQILAQWPNNNHYAHSPKALNDHTMFYAEENPSRWTEAKDWWIGMWASYDFQYYRFSPKELDVENKTITAIDGHSYPLTSYMSRRWAAFNLMEEIDIPGEYYIDRANMMLYLYPPYSLKDATVEMSITTSSILSVADASNITFRGIHFSQTQGNAVSLSRVDNIDFINCVFKDIGYTGISASGGTKPKTNSIHWHNLIHRDDSSYRVDVRGCQFYNMGCSAVCLAGGNIDKLASSEGIIEDNYVWGSSQKSWWSAIEVRGCGWTIRNNHINNGRKEAIYPAGNNHLIEYNEIYDCMRETGDAGAIYWGGDQLERGTMVQYNYIHDCAPIEKTGAGTVAIYWDDNQSGMSAQYNIIKGMHIDFNSNGAGATLHQYNTSVECNKTLSMHAHPYRATDIVTGNLYGQTIEQTIGDIYDKDLFFKAYPELMDYAKGINPKKSTIIRGNFAVNSGPNSISDEDKKFSAVIEGNTVNDVPDLSCFVDPENQDYRLKSDSDFAKTNPNILNDSNFDIESIGLKNDLVLNENTAPFKMTFPKNGTAAVSATDHQLVWDKAYGAHKYRLIVATDKELTNRVYDEIVNYNSMTVPGLEKGKTYYWTVYGLNKSREMANEWQASTGVYFFSTSLYEDIDTSSIDRLIKDSEKKMNQTDESDAPGDLKSGIKNRFKSYLSIARYLSEKKPVGVTNETLAKYGDYISAFFTEPSYFNQGYVDLSRYFVQSNWDGAVVEGDTLTLLDDSSGNDIAGSNNLAPISENVIYCFDAEFSFATGTYMTIGMSAKNNTHQYAANPGNYICLKVGLIEHQRNGNGVLETKEINLIDGKKHQFMMGRIRLGMGNYFVVYLDGELLYQIAEVDGTEFSELMQIVFATYGEGDMIRLSKFSGEIPAPDKYEELKKQGMNYAAYTILKNMEKDYVNPSAMNLNSNRVFTKDGIFEMSHKPVIEGADETFVTKDVIEKTLGCTVNGTSINGIGDVSSKVVDGVTLLSIKQACNLLGKSYTYDWENYNILVGDSGAIVVNNEQTRLKKLASILLAIQDYPVAEF